MAAIQRAAYAFKLLTPKDVAAVMGLLNVHPAVTTELIERPTFEFALNMFQNLAEYAYCLDVQQVKLQTHGQMHYEEIYEEALDMLTTFRLSKQLAVINGIDDFSMKDIWEPQAKRLRAAMSGIINFCRYKESQLTVTLSFKEDLHALDGTRLHLVERCNSAEQELSTLQGRHNEEMPLIWAAEKELADAQAVVDKLQKQRQAADRVQEDTETRLAKRQEQNEQLEQRAAQLREQVAYLEDQVAESPEGIELEKQELQSSILTFKAQLEEKTDMKRSRAQRVQVLGHLTTNLESYGQALESVKQSSVKVAAAEDKTAIARAELKALQASLEARSGEESDLGQGVKQVAADLDRAKEQQEERVVQLEARRQTALAQHQELQAKRSEEQRQLHAVQSQRSELEGELATERRRCEASIFQLQDRRRVIAEELEVYAENVDKLLKDSDAELGWTSTMAPPPQTSGFSALAASCSPAPARLLRRSPSPAPAACGDPWSLSSVSRMSPRSSPFAKTSPRAVPSASPNAYPGILKPRALAGLPTFGAAA